MGATSKWAPNDHVQLHFIFFTENSYFIPTKAAFTPHPAFLIHFKLDPCDTALTVADMFEFCHRLIWCLKLNPAQIFGSRSLHHTMAANSHLLAIWWQGNTANYTTGHHKIGYVNYLRHHPPKHSTFATQHCRLSTWHPIWCVCSLNDEATVKKNTVWGCSCVDQALDLSRDKVQGKVILHHY